MNCLQFQFVTPTIDVNVSIDWTSADGSQSWSINGQYSVEQVFSPSNRVKYALAMGCFPYGEDRADKKNWQPWSSDAFCSRFSLRYIGHQDGVYLYPFYMGQTPIYGTYTVTFLGETYTTDYLFYLNSDIGYTDKFKENNYWYIHERLKPWDDTDPFYPRAISMYNALPSELKAISVSLVGIAYNSPTPVGLNIYGTMPENADEQTVIFEYAGEIIGTADVKMSFKRQKVQ